MNIQAKSEHQMHKFSSILLFALFTFFLLSLLLFSTGVYKKTVSSAEYNRDLSTISSYLSEMIRQHDKTNAISITTVEDTTVLCLEDTINHAAYVTYIYEQDGWLKELFTKKDSPAALSMGNKIAKTELFTVTWKNNHLLSLGIQDLNGQKQSFSISVHSSQKGA